jgi:hypothetical protein
MANIAKGQLFESVDTMFHSFLFEPVNERDWVNPYKLAMVLGVATYTNPTHFDEDCMPYVVADYHTVKTGRGGSVDVGRDDEGRLYFTDESGLFDRTVVLYAFAGSICCSLIDEFSQEES